MTVYIRLDVVYTRVCLRLNMQQIRKNVSLNVAAEVDFCCCRSKLWRLYIVGKVFLKRNDKQRQATKIKREITQWSLKAMQDTDQVLQVLMLLILHMRWYKWWIQIWVKQINQVQRPLVSPTNMGIFKPKYLNKDKTWEIKTSWLLVLLIFTFLGQVWQLSVT